MRQNYSPWCGCLTSWLSTCSIGDQKIKEEERREGGGEGGREIGRKARGRERERKKKRGGEKRIKGFVISARVWKHAEGDSESQSFHQRAKRLPPTDSIWLPGVARHLALA